MLPTVDDEADYTSVNPGESFFNNESIKVATT